MRNTTELDNAAQRYGLSPAESRMIVAMARLAGTADLSIMLTTPDVFSQGAARLMQERFEAGDSIEDRRELKDAISSAYKKLGFGTPDSPDASRSRGVSSRHIPPGKKLIITKRRADDTESVQATVVENDEAGIVLQFENSQDIERVQRDFRRVKYFFGSSIWEFDANIIGHAENRMTLAHCERVRLTNRRRFLRVPITARAMVARFTFEDKNIGLEAALPRFVPASITELAGPGLKIEAELRATPGERVLLVMEFESGEIVRDIAEIRHVSTTQSTTCIALELVTLGEEGINTMVRLTNQASRGPRKEEPQPETVTASQE